MPVQEGFGGHPLPAFHLNFDGFERGGFAAGNQQALLLRESSARARRSARFARDTRAFQM